ncbi:hypothetical protein GCL60_01865 [Silvanigrella paludirubra]|uniref:Smf/DprA SLOG domain-containing protein n=1 Tax=Silvanigrella paludirubra TaxID=2499159 RepID=A0A6N6VVQ0_9BACT|nr:DNA-processing protein DprA [Silvanigrella paludirubra]KAB8040695.1 hypothetical protein GCL60_01865 [Silvanigrella paludirubra]
MINYNKYTNITKEELWLLQSKLKNNEIRKVTTYLTNKKDNSNFKFSEILDICNIDNKYDLLNFYNDLKRKETSIDNKFIDRFYLESILQKKLQHPSLLAFQYLGNPKILSKPVVAIIGSRKPTYYGRQQAQYFSKELAIAGCTILSGGAIGIDAIANAVGYEYGSTCAIIGSGIRNFYPSSNLSLFQKIGNSTNGLILSEFNSFEKPQKWNFPRRNLSIAAIAHFVLVIEAAVTSGSLITANAAAEFGIDVGALPGAVNHANSLGAIELIKNGAFCIQSPRDVLERISFLKQYKTLD